MRWRAAISWLALSSVVAGCATAESGTPATSVVPEQPAASLVISEIHYHDASGDASREFVELHNPTEAMVTLTGWCVKGVGFCFDAPTQIAPGAFVVVSLSDAEGGLSNQGESIRLTDPADSVRDSVEYGTRAPWPRSADGLGYSLQRLLPATDGSGPDAWLAAPPTPGAPTSESGRTTPAEPHVVINEVHYHDRLDDPAQEFIELLNPTSEPRSIEGWCVEGTELCVRAQVTLAPGAAHVLTVDSTDRRLPRARGALKLRDATGGLVDVVWYEDVDPWPALADGEGHSLQRRNPGLPGIEPGNWESAPPTPGMPNATAGTSLLALFDRVEHTRSPAPDEATTVRARLRDAVAATLVYRVDFGEEVRVDLGDAVGGVVEGDIPPQPAGSLVRYRLEADGDHAIGTFPRQGDGSRYAGTVVAASTESRLTTVQIFMPPEEFQVAYDDIGLWRDQGYPMVFAHDGVVFDNALIRVRGQVARNATKRKWKIVLPAGHVWEAAGVLPHPVDEFSLNSMITDKAMVREFLTSDLMSLAGGLANHYHPARMDLNGAFYGLYALVEPIDGQWRKRQGFTDDTIVFKAERQATLSVDHLSLGWKEFSQRYQRQTQRYKDVLDRTELEALIRAVASDTDAAVTTDFLHRHLDLPQIVNALAAMNVAQHLEWGHKNHVLLFDPADEKWRIFPIDHDLNFGKQWVPECGSYCDSVRAVFQLDHFGGNRLGSRLLRDPQIRAMIERRTKTLAGQFLAPGRLEARIAELGALIADDAARDRARWGSYGVRETPEEAQRILIDSFVVPKRELYVDDPSGRLPPSQSSSPTYEVTRASDGSVTVRNTDTVSIDLSGVTIAGLPAPVPSGTVLAVGQSAILTTEKRPAPAEGVATRSLHVWVPSR